MRKNIIQALKELPYTILLKYDTDNFPEKPSNVYIRKTFPQRDILGKIKYLNLFYLKKNNNCSGHPNIKVFVTQGGAQSIEEAIANEIPMVGIPFIGDQHMNINYLLAHGMAQRVKYWDITVEKLKNSIIAVA